MTVSESVIRWLKGFDADRLATVSTDMQTAEVKSYSLIKEPQQNVQHFLSGRKIITDHFTLMARLSNRTDAARVGNSGFGEALEEWIDAQNRAGKYPDIADAVVQEVGVTTPFCVGQTREHENLYQLTIAIRYMKEK